MESPNATPSSGLQPGLEARLEWTVGKGHLYNPGGRPGREVLSSPAMIMHMEKTAVEAVRPSLPANTATLGFHVDVKHIAPASPGAQVVTHARLTGVDGNKLTFEVTAHEGERLLGTGTHRRAIVPVD